MGRTISMRVPDKSINGASIVRGSVAGRKTQYAQQSTTVGASFTVSAGAAHSVTVNFDGWATDLADEARNDLNIISPDECIAWLEFDLYVDAFAVANLFGAVTLSAAQRKVHFSHVKNLTPHTKSGSTPDTATDTFEFRNDDASDHVIYIIVQYKYIVIGDANL